MNKRLNKKYKNIGISILTALAIGVFIALFANINVTTDERQMKMQLSDEIKASPFIINIASPLSLLIRGLYRLFPNLEIYYIVIYGAILFAIAVVIYVVLDRVKEMSGKTKVASYLFAVGLSLFCLLEFLLQIRFTYSGIILAMSAMVYILAKEKISLKSEILVLAICLFSAWFRWLAFAEILPFILLAIVYKLVLNKSNKKLFKRYVVLGVAVLVLAGGSKITNEWTYSHSNYKDILTVDYYRSELQDYQVLPTYDKAKDAYDEIGVSENQVKLIRHAMWGIADVTDVDTLKELLEFRNNYYSSQSLSEKLDSMLETFKETFPQVKTVYHVSAVVLVVLAFGIILKSKDKLKLALLSFTCLGVFAEVLYLCYKGRMPFRVFFPLELILIFVSSLIIMERFLQAEFKPKKICALMFAVMFVLGIVQTSLRAEKRLNSYSAYTKLTEEMMQKDDGNIYLYISSMAYSEASFVKEKSDSDNSSLYMNAGGNLSETPYWYNIVCGEYSSVAQALANRKDIKFVSEKNNKDVLNICEYLNSEGYSVSYECEEISVEGKEFKIWEIVSNE